MRVVVRRRSWGSEDAHASRARRVFGAPAAYGRLAAVGLSRTPFRSGGMRGEWLIPPRPVPSVVLYVHGGGFVSCSATTHRPIAAALARLTRRAVVSVDYRLAPEARLPAAHEDITAAFELVVASGTPSSEIALVGDSAGGNLVLSLAVRLRDQGAGAVACMSVLLKLLDDAKRVQEQIHRVGGECSLRVYEDVPHCWQVLFPLMPEAIESLQDTATFIDASLADTGGRTVLPYARCKPLVRTARSLALLDSFAAALERYSARTNTAHCLVAPIRQSDAVVRPGHMACSAQSTGGSYAIAHHRTCCL